MQDQSAVLHFVYGRCWPLLWSAVFIGALLIPLLTGQEQTGVGADIQLQNGQTVVISVDRWDVGGQAGLSPGDRIVSIDGTRLVSQSGTLAHLPFGSGHRWTVQRGSHLVILHPGQPEDRQAQMILIFIAFVLWALATFVRLKKPRDKLTHRLYWLELTFALVLAMHIPAGNGSFWAYLLETTAMAVAPACFASFCQLAAHRHPRHSETWIPPALLTAGIAAGALSLLGRYTQTALFDLAHWSSLAVVAVSFVYGLYVLFQGWRHPTSVQHGRQVRVILIGLTASQVPILLLTLLPELLGHSALADPEQSATSVVFLPLCLAYAVLYERFLDIPVAVGRALVYAVMTLLLALGYAIFLAALRLAGFEPSALDFFPTVLFSAVLVITFIPAWNGVRHVIDRLVFHDRYDYVNVVGDLGKQLSSVQPLDDVLSNVVCRLASAMNLDSAAILLQRTAGGFAVRGASGMEPQEIAELEFSAELARNGDWERAGQCWLPLQAHGTTCGLLYLGRKRTGIALTETDRRLAQTIAGQAAVAVANALLVDRLREKVGELELLQNRLLDLQNRERRSVAQDLHDSALHTVLNLVRFADGAAAARQTGPELRAALRQVAELGHDAAYELREICAQLYPSELAHLGLPAALERLTEIVAFQENVDVQVDLRQFPRTCRLSPEIEEAIYMVAREALENVARHAEASTAIVCLCLHDGAVKLTVSDNGPGFVPLPSAALVRRGHLGLVGMRDRAVHLGGHFTCASRPGSGTVITVAIPLGREGAMSGTNLEPAWAGE